MDGHGADNLLVRVRDIIGWVSPALGIPLKIELDVRGAEWILPRSIHRSVRPPEPAPAEPELSRADSTSSDFPPHAASERSSLLSSMLETSLGKERASDPFYQRLWGIFGGLATHDFSAMREIFGMPRGVLAATKAPNAMFYNVVFE